MVSFRPRFGQAAGLSSFPAIIPTVGTTPRSERPGTSTTSLVSLAMLIVNDQERHEDYLDYLNPFLIEVIRSDCAHGVNRNTAQNAILERFGLTIPSQTVELCLKRMALRGYLELTKVYGNPTYSPMEALPVIDLERERRESIDICNGVISSLVRYAFERYGQDWSLDRAADTLTAYLGAYGIESLRAYVGRSALPVLGVDHRDYFVINSFIRDAQTSNQDLFEKVVHFVQCQMLVNALLCTDLAVSSSKFSNLSIFFDTPLVLGLLGYHGEDGFNLSKETVDLCKSLGAKTAIFSHTALEVYSVIRGCAMHLNDEQQKGRMAFEMRRLNISQAELLLRAANLDLDLANVGLQRIDTPPHISEFEIGERVLDTVLEDEIRQYNPRARNFDIDSIRSIYTLRRDAQPTSIESSVAVLVTTNTALARAAFQYGQQFESSKEISTVISSFSLANIAWLKGKMVDSNLPRVEMMALAYAALHPSSEMWQKYLDKAEDMRKRGLLRPKDHAIARFSLRIQEDLMQLTLGDEEQISDETVFQLVKQAESELVREERERHLEAEARYRKDSELTAAELEAVRAERDGIRSQLDGLLVQRKQALERIRSRSDLLGRFGKWGVYSVLFAAYGTVTYGIQGLFTLSNFIKTPVAVGSALIITVLTANGISFRSWASGVGDWIAGRAFVFFARDLALPPLSQSERELPENFQKFLPVSASDRPAEGDSNGAGRIGME